MIVVFIFAQRHCIDINNESVTVTVDIKDTTEQRDGTNTTETVNINQSTIIVPNITDAPEHKSAMEWCNETYPTSKGTHYTVC